MPTKRPLPLTICLFLLFLLAACGGASSTPTTQHAATKTPVAHHVQPIVTQVTKVQTTPTSTSVVPSPVPSVVNNPGASTYNGSLTNDTKKTQDTFTLDQVVRYTHVTSMSGYATITGGLNGSGHFTGFFSSTVADFLITPAENEGSGSSIVFTGKVSQWKATGSYNAANNQQGSWSFTSMNLETSVFTGTIQQDGDTQPPSTLQVKLDTASTSVALAKPPEVDGITGSLKLNTFLGSGTFVGVVSGKNVEFYVGATDVFAVTDFKAIENGTGNFTLGIFTMSIPHDNDSIQKGTWTASPVTD